MIFGEFAPDKAKSGNPNILTECEGVYPLEDGYRPVGQFTKLSDAIAAHSQGWCYVHQSRRAFDYHRGNGDEPLQSLFGRMDFDRLGLFLA
jgi:hypothetical protein